MVIALDIDKTWTEDPGFWCEYFDLCKKYDHEIIFVTGRRNYSDDLEKYGLFFYDDNYVTLDPYSLGKIKRVIYCTGKPKRATCEYLGIKIDIWIDDCPEMIVNCLGIGDDGEL